LNFRRALIDLSTKCILMFYKIGSLAFVSQFAVVFLVCLGKYLHPLSLCAALNIPFHQIFPTLHTPNPSKREQCGKNNISNDGNSNIMQTENLSGDCPKCNNQFFRSSPTKLSFDFAKCLNTFFAYLKVYNDNYFTKRKIVEKLEERDEMGNKNCLPCTLYSSLPHSSCQVSERPNNNASIPTEAFNSQVNPNDSSLVIDKLVIQIKNELNRRITYVIQITTQLLLNGFDILSETNRGGNIVEVWEKIIESIDKRLIFKIWSNVLADIFVEVSKKDDVNKKTLSKVCLLIVSYPTLS
jgi:hypothetical protein